MGWTPNLAGHRTYSLYTVEGKSCPEQSIRQNRDLYNPILEYFSIFNEKSQR